jgi:hypothetical protein
MPENENPNPLPFVVIDCPATDVPIQTGLTMDEQTFETAELDGNTVPCPACGSTHKWSKDDARLSFT